MKTRLTCTNRIDGLAIVILLLMASMPYEEMRMKRSEHMRREGRVRVEGGGGGLKKTRLTSTNRIGGLAIIILLPMGSGGYEEMRMKRSEQMRREGRVRVEGKGNDMLL